MLNANRLTKRVLQASLEAFLAAPDSLDGLLLQDYDEDELDKWKAELLARPPRIELGRPRPQPDWPAWFVYRGRDVSEVDYLGSVDTDNPTDGYAIGGLHQTSVRIDICTPHSPDPADFHFLLAKAFMTAQVEALGNLHATKVLYQGGGDDIVVLEDVAPSIVFRVSQSWLFAYAFRVPKTWPPAGATILTPPFYVHPTDVQVDGVTGGATAFMDDDEE